ncbi:hypothetical protein CLV46_1145 [Diaminobutyricimonas aerilata]|uniref:General stress protein 17M-like domain-containing protein n=1 Tax=Diaminobutyricimonas aerilata TaxID=1162967 RepID=A0A2M9CI47_9MICO|nr:general stress protein [Diaminobutyricimonas aerilata]PJJ71596.1 hypothetical protein CLV46_1145 [Diaminobutyricimonas aerilata]
MTNAGLFGRRGPNQPSLPRGEVLGTYDTYPEAQQIVDRLAKAEVDVSRVSIVGNDLKTVERVTGRLTYGRAAAAGAASGAWFGLFFGVLLTFVTPNLLFLGAAVLIGAGFGMLFGLVTYAVNRRVRDFTSQTQVLASNYQIIVAPDVLVRAQDALARPDTEHGH